MSVPDLYIPDNGYESVKRDFEMYKIIKLLNKHKEILELASDGKSARETGKKLNLGLRTVENYIYSMVKETGVKNKTALITVAIRLKIIE